MMEKAESPKPKDNDFLHDRGYTDFRKIESGGQGTVYFAIKGHKPYAVKVIRVEFPDQKKMGDDLQRELTIITKLKHPNMIRVEEIMRTRTKVYIFMEYAPKGTVGSYVRKNGAICEWNAKVWFCPIADALKYLHDNRIAHRDLKLDNILLDAHLNPKLTDFGFSRFVTIDPKTRKVTKSDTFCGTPSYYPPEILLKIPYDPFKADIWCLGICLFAMLNDDYPFNKDDKKEMYNDQINGKWRWKSRVEEKVSADVRDLLTHLLDPNTKTRYDGTRVCQHMWFPVR